MEEFFVLVLGVALFVFFSDIVLMLFVRIGVFSLMILAACYAQEIVASTLVDSGLITHYSLATIIGFGAVILLCWPLFQWSGEVCCRNPTNVQAVGLDVLRAGLLIAVMVAGFATLATAVTGGKPPLGTWIWLLILAGCAAGADVCFPSVFGGAVQLISTKTTVFGGKRNA